MRGPAPAKINLALVVGPLRKDGKHELLTVYQRVGLADRIDVDPAARTHVEGFAGDRLVRDALERLAVHAAVAHGWHARVEKRIPVAAGLGGGSSDAATALRLANATLDGPVPAAELHDLAAELGADVPFFLVDGPRLGSGDGDPERDAGSPIQPAVVVRRAHPDHFGVARHSLNRTTLVPSARFARRASARVARPGPPAGDGRARTPWDLLR